MLIYAESKIFPSKTFVVLVHAGNKVAYLRAQLLHVLFEIGHEDHQFRLRYKGQYLRDAFSLLDYDLPENALVHMIPVSANTEAAFDVQSVSSLGSDSSSRYLHGVQDVVHKEIRHLSRRERMCLDFKTLLYVHFIATIFAAFTAFWYSLIWIGVLMMFGVFMCPTYTRLGGFVGKNMIWRVWFSIIYGVFGVCSVIAAITFATIEWSGIANHGCTGWVLVDECSPQHLYSSLFFTIHSVVQLTSTVIAWYLYWNFRYELGDFIEKYLVQEKSIDELMKTATMGRLKDKRMAAYELAILAASDDDNKFKIVEEGGLDVLLNLALSADEATQEYAMETLAELVTVLTIQDQFVEVDGVRTVVPLLHSSCERVVQETLLTLYNVIADSELNKSVIVADHGLEDIAHVAHRGSKSCQRIAASILLELAFNTEIRGQMAVTNTPAAALTELSKSDEPDTQRYALQTLELLAIERPQVIYAQDELMSILLTLHHRTLNENLYLLAGKILLYYAEDQQCSELLLADPHMTECLQTFAHSHDGLLQKVVVKIIDCMLDTRQHKLQADVLGFSAILTDIRANAADRETWDMADQGVGVKRLLCAAFVLLGLFISLIPEIFSLGSLHATALHGVNNSHNITTYSQTKSGTNNTPLQNESTVVYSWAWPLARVGSTVSLSIAIVIFEREIKSPEVSFITFVFWAGFFKCISLVALFWTTLIPNFGMTDDIDEFMRSLGRGLYCTFRNDTSCNGCQVSGISFTLIATFANILTFLLTKYAEGAIYTTVIKSSSKPLSTLFWTLFTDAGLRGLLWRPQFNLNTIMAFTGLLIVIPATCLDTYLSNRDETSSNGTKRHK